MRKFLVTRGLKQIAPWPCLGLTLKTEIRPNTGNSEFLNRAHSATCQAGPGNKSSFPLICRPRSRPRANGESKFVFDVQYNQDFHYPWYRFTWFRQSVDLPFETSCGLDLILAQRRSCKSRISVTVNFVTPRALTVIYQHHHRKAIFQRKIEVMSTAKQAKKAKMSGDSMSSGQSVADLERLVWVDLEMTGLDIDTCHIIEAACLITDGQLNIIAEGPNIVIHQPDEIMDNMNSWCKDHHGKSGLTEQVRKSEISLQQAEMELLSFVRMHTPRGKCPLAGNSIHADKKFLDKYMPQFMAHLHYRIVDVSTIKELCRRWYPSEYEKAPRKAGTHRALDDIRESIKELQYYREALFKQNTENDSLSNTEA